MTVSTTPPPENATIFALATGLGGAIAVMRISGPQSRFILQNLCSGALPEPRRASHRRLRYQNDILDEAVVLWLPGPYSYTGEDGAELHLHAGPAVTMRSQKHSSHMARARRSPENLRAAPFSINALI